MTPAWTTRPDDIDALALGNPDGSPNLDVQLDSSLLVDDISIFTGSGYGGPGSVTCDYSNLPSATIPSPWTDNCPLGGASTNTSDVPSDLFVGGPPASYDWQLKDGSPAIDSGRPGPIDPGFSTRDLAGKLRRAPSDEATCADPIRDKGAYERAAVLCPPVNRSLPTIPDSDAPTIDARLHALPGRWTDHPDTLSTQWLRCQPANPSDCTPITPGGDAHRYTATGDDAGFVLRAQVIATNAAGDSAPAVSAPTGVVECRALNSRRRRASPQTGRSPPSVA